MDAREALDRWVADGLMTSEQAELLAGTLEAERRDRGRLGVITVLVGVGSVLIGGGLLLFVASQWDQQSPVRRLLLLAAVYALVVAAAALTQRWRLSTTARWLWFLSSLVVGANIFLAGQIFNQPLNYWQGTAAWMIAAVSMGVASPSRPHGWLIVLLGLLTLGWSSVPSAEFFDQAAFLFDQRGIHALLPLIGLALLAGGVLVDGSAVSFLAPAARAIGAILVAVPVVVSTFHPEVFDALFSLEARAFHVVVLAACAAVIAAVWWRSRDAGLAVATAVAGVLAVVVLVQSSKPDRGIHGRPETSPWLAEHFADSELLFGAYGALVLLVAVAVALAGHQRGSPALVNAGLTAVGVLTLAIYIGRVAGALPTSLAVLIGGVVLVAGGTALERIRRDLLGAAPEVAT